MLGFRTARFHLPNARPASNTGRRSPSTSCVGKHNPQNVENPKVMPDRAFSPQKAVEVQLDALRENGEPWMNHGLLTMYEFAEDVGGMERSRYFGYSKDLYHFDHFMGTIQQFDDFNWEFGNKFSDVIDHQGYKIIATEEGAPGTCDVIVQVQGTSQDVTQLRFKMKIKDIGRKKGCWMTATLVRAE